MIGMLAFVETGLAAPLFPYNEESEAAEGYSELPNGSSSSHWEALSRGMDVNAGTWVKLLEGQAFSGCGGGTSLPCAWTRGSSLSQLDQHSASSSSLHLQRSRT